MIQDTTIDATLNDEAIIPYEADPLLGGSTPKWPNIINLYKGVVFSPEEGPSRHGPHSPPPLQGLFGPVVPSFRALSGRLKLAVRRQKFNKDSLPRADTVQEAGSNLSKR